MIITYLQCIEIKTCTLPQIVLGKLSSKHEILNIYFLVIFYFGWISLGIFRNMSEEKRNNNGVTNEKAFLVIVEVFL